MMKATFFLFSFFFPPPPKNLIPACQQQLDADIFHSRVLSGSFIIIRRDTNSVAIDVTRVVQPFFFSLLILLRSSVVD